MNPALTETEPGEFLARFTVEPCDDLPNRCFKVLSQYRIVPRSLSIFRENAGSYVLSVTLRTGLCSEANLKKAVDELIQCRIPLGRCRVRCAGHFSV